MSVRPKYFYKLSIYDPEDALEQETRQPPNGWNFKLGLGERIMGLVASSIDTKKSIKLKADDVKDYASSTEGRLKLGFMASCACLGGIVALVRKPSGLLRKLVYPTGFLGVSSAICYPSKAYLISKVCAVNLATGLYSSGKITSEKVNSILEQHKIKKEKKRAEEEAKRAEEDEKMVEEEASEDVAPIRNAPVSEEKMDEEESVVVESQDIPVEEKLPTAPVSEEKMDGEESVVVESQDIPMEEKLPEFSVFTTIPVEDERLPELMQKERNDESQRETQDSLLDFGQSSREDTDLYTTRS